MKTLLSYLIASTGLTQKQLCDQIQARFGESAALGQSTISSAALGHPMRVSTAQILSEYFRVPPGALQLPVGGQEEAQPPAPAPAPSPAPMCTLDADERAWRPRYRHDYGDGATDEVDLAPALCLEEALATAYSLLESEATPPEVFVVHQQRGLRLTCASLAAFRKRRADTNG